MSSHTDKKEEFRKYLEKSNVLATLTEILTDLFEMDNKPEDPARYVYQKLGECLEKGSIKNANTKPANGPTPVMAENNQKDTAMTDVAPTQPNAVVTQPTEASVNPTAPVSTSAPPANITSQQMYSGNAITTGPDVKTEMSAKPELTANAELSARPDAAMPPVPIVDGTSAPQTDGNDTNNATTGATAPLSTTNSASVQ